jgi:hypothetical protein
MKKLTVLLCVLAFASQGQDKSYRNYNYKWSAPETMALDQKFLNEDVVILDEVTSLELIHDPAYYRYNYNIEIEKRIRLRFNTQKGIDKYNVVSMPETFDPFADNFFHELSPAVAGHQPKGDFDFLKYFKARIIRPDGSVHEITPVDSAEIQAFYIRSLCKKFALL